MQDKLLFTDYIVFSFSNILPPISYEKLKPTVIPQKKERSEPKGLKTAGPFSLLNGVWVKFLVLNVQLNSAWQRRDLHPQTDWKRMLWHEFLISSPWAKFVLTCTGHQFCYSQFILRKVKEEIRSPNSLLIFIFYWQITCNNLDVIELPLPVISWILLAAFFWRSRFDFFQHKPTILKF